MKRTSGATRTSATALALTLIVGVSAATPAKASLTPKWLGTDYARVAVKHRVAAVISAGGGALDGQPSITCTRLASISLRCKWRQGVIASSGDRYSICESTFRVALSRGHIRLSLVPGTYNVCADTPFPDPS